MSPTFASGLTKNGSAPTNLLNAFQISPPKVLLDPSFNPNAPVGGVPFCSSGGLGTILCYPPSFLKKAYDFPPTTGEHALDGTGSTVVIVDAFGSPTIQSDLNTYDAAFNIPAGTVTVLCGPTWTGAASDNCPVKTIADLTTAPNAGICGATGWAEETTLDVTTVHALAPGAKVILAVSNDCFDTSFNTAQMAVVSQHSLRGSIMSQSFGEPDDLVGCLTVDPVTLQCTSTDPTIKANADAMYQLAKHNKWTVIASSGDDGANTDARVLGTGELTPSWPATNPLNLAAGGTMGQPYGGQYGGPPGPGGKLGCGPSTKCNTGLVVISGGANGCGTAVRPGEPSSCVPLGYGGEGTWNEFNFFGLGTSSGGGTSSLYDRPSYQSDVPHTFTTLLGATAKTTGRLVPDVSFNSAIYGGVLAFLGFLGPHGIWAVFGGTSAAAPSWAAIIALVNQANDGKPVGFINPAIYALGQNQDNHHGGGGDLATAQDSGGNHGSHDGGGDHGGVVFHDITGGNNSDTAGQFGVDGYTALKGYDLTTGWGTPDVANFINAILQQSGH